jgi:hypothetical protein
MALRARQTDLGGGGHGGDEQEDGGNEGPHR